MRSPMLLVLMALACSGGKDEAAESGGGESSSPGDTSEGGDDTGVATLCPEDVDLFEERVWDPVLSTYCLGCLNSDGPASGTRMVFEADDMLHNLQHGINLIYMIYIHTHAISQLGCRRVFFFFLTLGARSQAIPTRSS